MVVVVVIDDAVLDTWLVIRNLFCTFFFFWCGFFLPASANHAP